MTAARPVVAACLTWSDQRPEVDPLTGTTLEDARSSRMSAADQAALEWALRSAALSGAEVLAATVGPSGADDGLRHAMACGATRAVRVDAPADLPSATVAMLLSDVVAGAAFVWCGDYSTRRGSGSVPAFLAAHLGVAQALGLVGITVGTDRHQVVRRLDGGRRERLLAGAPAVLSVEGSTARLRRASLRQELRARTAVVEVRAAGAASDAASPERATTIRPYRPRARALAAPRSADALDRVLALTHAGGGGGRSTEIVHLPPDEAADRILALLAEHGVAPTDAVATGER
jgi:electron transfer flavoprotein beta subunit